MIDRATIQPGAIVSALAELAPASRSRAGFRVLPGKNVTTNAEASNPALGKVVAVTSADVTALNKQLAANLSLAQGYNTLYQGQSATGPSPGVDPAVVSGIINGNLRAIEGASQQPGSPTATTAFLPPGVGPKFPSPHQGLVSGNLNTFRARVTGGAVFHARARDIAHHLGRSNSIRADQGQPITIGSIGQTGNGVTIDSPGGGQLTIGQNLVVGNNATILGDATTKTVIGDNVSIGNGAVLDGTSLGSGTTVGTARTSRTRRSRRGRTSPRGPSTSTTSGSAPWSPEPIPSRHAAARRSWCLTCPRHGLMFEVDRGAHDGHPIPGTASRSAISFAPTGLLRAQKIAGPGRDARGLRRSPGDGRFPSRVLASGDLGNDSDRGRQPLRRRTTREALVHSHYDVVEKPGKHAEKHRKTVGEKNFCNRSIFA